MYNLLIGGAAGQGVDTFGSTIHQLLKQAGYNVFVTKDVMSRVRGGHNFSLIRFGAEQILGHDWMVDGIIALNDETVELHRDRLREGGFILGDDSLKSEDDRLIKMNMAGKAKELGNVRAQSSIALGAFAKLMNIPVDHALEAFEATLKSQYVEVNVKAAQYGYGLVEPRYPLQAGQWQDGSIVLNGNQAIGLGAVAAGLTFYTAYPMSPSTSILEYLAAVQHDAGLVVEQAEDEIAALNAAIGASYAGARAATGTSGGGFSLMVEALGMSGQSEVPVVVFDAMRPGPVTGFPTRTEQGDLLFVAFASQGEFPRLVMSCRSHEDCFYQTMRAFDIAERFQIPVVVLTDQYLADGDATIRPLDPTRVKVAPVGPAEGEIDAMIAEDGEYLRFKVTESGVTPRMLPGDKRGYTAVDTDEHDERGYITEGADERIAQVDKRNRKEALIEAALEEPWVLGEEEPDVLLICWGSIYGPMKEALELLKEDGIKAGALCFGDVYPLPTKELEARAPKARFVINVEQNSTGQLAKIIRMATGRAMDDSVLRYDGRQLSAQDIRQAVRKSVKED